MTTHSHTHEPNAGNLAACDVGRFEDLRAPEQFTLWAIRMWVLGKRRDQQVGRKLREGFAQVGAPSAAVWLETMMRTLTSNLCRNVIVHCVCDRRTSADEHMLLELLARGQVGDEETVLRCLNEFITASAVHTAGPLVTRLGETLADGGVLLGSTCYRTEPAAMPAATHAQTSFAVH